MTHTYQFFYNQDPDAIRLSWKRGWGVWNPTQQIDINDIESCFSIDQLIDHFNEDISERGISGWHQNTRYFLPQIIKINLLYHDLRSNSNRKPMLLRKSKGYETWYPLTGDTRLRVYELIGLPIAVSAVLVTESCPGPECSAINDRDEFAQACDAPGSTSFLLRVGDKGLEWYEMAVDVSCCVTGQTFIDEARRAIIKYVAAQGPGFRIDRDWFCTQHNWQLRN
jgi:hypothetical protein